MALEAVGERLFQAPPPPDKGEATFGGQLLAQCLAAAQATVPNGRAVHSLHAYFLRPGDVHFPAAISVEEVRDGRAFSCRQAQVRQGGKERFRMLASFQVSAQAPEYQGPKAPQVAPPEAAPLTYDDFVLGQTGADAWHGAQRPVDIRYLNPPTAPQGEPVTENQLMWMRIPEPLPDDPHLHRAALAYLSDASLVDHIVLPHGLRWQDGDFGGTSLDHAMWFHRFARADQWLLFEQCVESTGGGRGLARGYFFDPAGTLIATCMQEGLMRWKTG